MKRYSGAVIITGLFSFPFIALLLWSLSEQWFYPALWPQKFGLRSWHYLFSTTGAQITTAILQSLSLATLTSFCSLVIGLPAGKVLGQNNFPGKNLVILLLMAPIIVPPLCVSMGLHLWFIKLGLAETFAGVILIHLTFCLPYTVFVLWGVFANYDHELEQQARSLGASPSQVIYRVMLPTIFPGICVAALFSFLVSWAEYLSTLIIGGGKLLTLPILLFALIESGDRPVAATVSIVFIAPAFLVLLFSAHHLGRNGLAGER